MFSVHETLQAAANIIAIGSIPAVNVFDISVMEMTFYVHLSSEVDVKHIKHIKLTDMILPRRSHNCYTHNTQNEHIHIHTYHIHAHSYIHIHRPCI